MSPRAFDPMQRARDFTRQPSPRRLLVSTERRLDGLDHAVSMAIDLAVQPVADTPVEYVTELPMPARLGQQVILRRGGETPDTYYLGMLGSGDVAEWVAVTSGDITSSPEFSFIGHLALTGAGANALSGSATEIRFALDNLTDIRDNVRGETAIGVPVINYPSASSTGAGRGLYFDVVADDMYVTIPANNWIEKATPTITTSPLGHRHDFWGLGKDSIGASLYATDFAGNQCHKIAMSNLQVSNTFATTGLSGPKGIATDASGNVFVADTGNNRVRKYNPSFTHLLDFGAVGSDTGLFNAPQGLAVDGSDRLYVADSGNNRIQVFSCSDGAYLGKFGSLGTGDGQLSGPTDVSVSGNLIDVADRGNERLSLWRRV